ncbi:NUMOD4 motif-containing HNH endonuclease [Gottfriedia acidiceleris]|uniref:NUMOD4 motif-containing HNH endonuclease n=1 Tax=Gottfriedia acidiceleris TaxID=371036 RepID=UPI002FFD613A
MPYEIWKDIPGFEGLYQASNLGNIKALKRIKWSGKGFYFKDEQLLKPGTDPNGYNIVVLCPRNKKKSFRVHRLIAKTFIPNRENKRCVNHKNGIKSDNRWINLEWATHSENNKHAYDCGLKKSSRKLV